MPESEFWFKLIAKDKVKCKNYINENLNTKNLVSIFNDLICFSVLTKIKANSVSVTKEKNKSEIFETMGGCVASCCASGEKMVHKTSSKTKTPQGNKKKRFGWFSR